jgi:hypothetical protein
VSERRSDASDRKRRQHDLHRPDCVNVAFDQREELLLREGQLHRFRDEQPSCREMSRFVMSGTAALSFCFDFRAVSARERAGGLGLPAERTAALVMSFQNTPGAA